MKGTFITSMPQSMKTLREECNILTYIIECESKKNETFPIKICF